MGLDQVIEDVLEEGRKEAEATVEEAKQEADAILEEARSKAQAAKEARAQEAETRAAAERRRILASAELDAKKKRLDAEADVLAAIRSRVETRLKKLPDDERTRLLRTLVEDSGAADFGQGAEARGRPEDRETLEKLGFTYAGEIDCIGGAVIESPDGNVREDLRFDAILDEVWREEMHGVASDVLER